MPVTDIPFCLPFSAGESMYHALGYATIAYLQAVMTYEQVCTCVSYTIV